MDLSGLLQGQVGNQLIEGVMSQLGVGEGQAKSAVSAAIPVLMTALNKNAQGGGADSLFNALAKHDGSILDNIGGFLNGGNFSDGAGILSHVLGGSQANVENSLSKSSGLSTAQIGKVLMMVAPIVMGYLGRQKQQQSLDSNGLGSLLGGLIGDAKSSNNSEMSMIEKMLDQNGDGSIMDDVMNLGSKFLGGLFGGSK